MVVGKPKNKPITPFGLVLSGDSQFISSGRCYSTFSYSVDSLVPIQGFGVSNNFKLTKDDVVYLDVTILQNLQISGAQISHGIVGKNASSSGWQCYPDQYLIKPYDIKNSEGRVTQIVDGKVQQKYYLMVGRCSENKPQNSPYNVFTITGASSNYTGSFYYEQYVDNDMIAFINQVSGTPIVFASPYFGGPYYRTPEENQ